MNKNRSEGIRSRGVLTEGLLGSRQGGGSTKTEVTQDSQITSSVESKARTDKLDKGYENRSNNSKILGLNN